MDNMRAPPTEANKKVWLVTVNVPNYGSKGASRTLDKRVSIDSVIPHKISYLSVSVAC